MLCFLLFLYIFGTSVAMPSALVSLASFIHHKADKTVEMKTFCHSNGAINDGLQIPYGIDFSLISMFQLRKVLTPSLAKSPCVDQSIDSMFGSSFAGLTVKNYPKTLNVTGATSRDWGNAGFCCTYSQCHPNKPCHNPISTQTNSLARGGCVAPSSHANDLWTLNGFRINNDGDTSCGVWPSSWPQSDAPPRATTGGAFCCFYANFKAGDPADFVTSLTSDACPVISGTTKQDIWPLFSFFYIEDVAAVDVAVVCPDPTQSPTLLMPPCFGQCYERGDCRETSSLASCYNCSLPYSGRLCNDECKEGENCVVGVCEGAAGCVCPPATHFVDNNHCDQCLSGFDLATNCTTCLEGYRGDNCNISCLTCNALHGQCNETTGYCKCGDAWHGDSCNECRCTSSSAPYAICDDASPTCACVGNRTNAPACDQCKPDYYNLAMNCSVYCSNDTTCNAPRGYCEEATGGCRCAAHVETNQDGSCVDCIAGYWGRDCSFHCTNATTCNGRGYCDDAGGTGDGGCVCDVGWSAAGGCSYCAQDYFPVGNCTQLCNAKHKCGGRGKCDENGDCVCFSSFWYDEGGRCDVRLAVILIPLLVLLLVCAALAACLVWRRRRESSDFELI